MINRNEAVVLDVRDKKEFDSGHIVDSINIPVSKLGQRVTELDKHKQKPVVVVLMLFSVSVLLTATVTPIH